MRIIYAIFFIILIQVKVFANTSSQNIEIKSKLHTEDNNFVDYSLAHTIQYTFNYAQNDKKLHYAAGMIVALSSTKFSSIFTSNQNIIKGFGLISSIGASLAKEYYDKRRGGKFDIEDSLYTAIAGSLLTLRLTF